MITTKVSVDPVLAEYAQGRFFDTRCGAVLFPDTSDMYVTLWDLLTRRPADSPVDRGNLEIALPNRREGKRPETYNYISARGADIIGRRLRVMMYAELHDLMEQNKHLAGIQYRDTVHQFMARYGIEAVGEDALLKNYQRWRDKARRRIKRPYRN